MDIYEIRRKLLSKLLRGEPFYGNKTEFASAIKVSPSYLSRMLKEDGTDRKRIGEDMATRIQEALQLPDGYLLNPVLDERRSSDVAKEEPLGLPIPVLANSGSMGAGAEALGDDMVVGRLSLSPQWIHRTLPSTNPNRLRFIHGYGDSMQPTFQDGDVLLVDTEQNDAENIDGIYVLEANNRLYIKRVRQTISGKIEISSDNPTVKTIDVLDGTTALRVLGKVVWLWNGRKL